MTRFMKPRYFAEDQLRAIESLLATRQIGDDEGQRIFVIALEYELAEFEDLLAESAETAPPAPTAADETLAGLSAVAANLYELIHKLPDTPKQTLLARMTTADRFAREHTEQYLGALLDELLLLSVAAKQPSSASAQVEAEPSVAIQTLVGRVAEAYAECFETNPDSDGPFPQLMLDIIRISELPVDLDQPKLARLLDPAVN